MRVGPACCRLRYSGSVLRGGVSERPKERDSKSREGQPSVGSNPTATAKAKARLPLVTKESGPSQLHKVVRDENIDAFNGITALVFA